MQSNEDVQPDVFLNEDSGKKETNKRDRKPNEILKRFIYIQAKSNVNRFAIDLGISRQFLFGIIGGYMQPSISLARKICDKLGVEDTRLIFPDGSLHYPDIVTADQYKTDGEPEELKDTPQTSIQGEDNE